MEQRGLMNWLSAIVTIVVVSIYLLNNISNSNVTKQVNKHNENVLILHKRLDSMEFVYKRF